MPEEVRSQLEFILAEDMSEVLDAALEHEVAPDGSQVGLPLVETVDSPAPSSLS